MRADQGVYEVTRPALCLLSFLTLHCRWQVVAPTGLAHATTADDQYDGFHIPKGATVWGNIKYVHGFRFYCG